MLKVKMLKPKSYYQCEKKVYLFRREKIGNNIGPISLHVIVIKGRKRSKICISFAIASIDGTDPSQQISKPT